MSECIMSNSKYETSKIDGKEYCKINGQFTRHLRQHGLDYREYYEKYITGKKESCGCGKPKTFYPNKKEYATTCGDPKCVGSRISEVKGKWSKDKRQKITEKRLNTLSKKPQEYWDDIQEKRKETCVEKFGAYITQSEYFMEKSKKTKLEKYGDEFYNNSEKSAEKNRNKTKEEQNKINDKRRKTNKERHGVENTFMKPGVKEKAAYKNSTGKDYIMPSGKVVGIRGYENLVLDRLLETHGEDELVIDDRKSDYALPSFEYVNYNQHTSKYYPDIYIPGENKIIEVKSRWWWDANGNPNYKGRIENNRRKWQAVVNEGYDYEVWVFEDKNNYEIKRKI